MPANGSLVEFAGNSVRFHSADSQLLDTIATHFRHCAGRGRASVIADFEVTALPGDRFSARVDGSDRFQDLDRSSALVHLMQDAITRLNGAATEALIFHAAALARDGKGLILCGRTHSGKSSLAAWLTACGMQYLTDEVISVPPDGESLSGLCRSIVLKPDSAFIWRRWLKDQHAGGFLRFADDAAWIDPLLLNPDGIRSSASPKLIIFPRYEAGAPFQTERLSHARTLFHLLQHLVNARNFPDGGLQTAAHLARGVAAFMLTYSDIEAAHQWIEGAL